MGGALTLLPVHLDSLADDGRSLLTALARREWVDDFYLAGSAALALYAAHRPVHGLDLMANANRLASPQRRDLLEDLLEMDPGFRVETARDGFLYARSGAGVALRLYYYPYPLIAPVEEVPLEEGRADGRGVAVCSALDLGLMKIGAIISRGTKRDFVDLRLLCSAEGGALPLATMLDRAPEKFGHVRDFPLQALKGMADLAQAEGEPMPDLAAPVEWDDVKAWFRQQVRDLGRSYVGLPSPDQP